MLCARCQKNQATVHLKQIVDNQVSEVHLCLSCAQAQEMPEGAAPALAGLLSLLGAAAPRERPSAARCGSCGLRWTDFRKSGFLGCPGCYDSFSAALRPVLKEMQGAARHGGKVPPRAARAVEDKRAAGLRKRLEEALAREDYEEAARLRDQLRKAAP